MSELFISDLDGTLLNAQRRISENTKNIINTLTARGVHFSVATARNIGTGFDKIAPLRLQTPVSFMNGVFIYRQNDPAPLSVLPLPEADARFLLEASRQAGASAMFYTLDRRTNRIELQYADLDFPARRAYYEMRKNSPYKQFICTDRYVFREACTPVYINFLEEYETLRRVRAIVETRRGLRSVFYYDPALKAWYLEVFSARAGKDAGARQIAQIVGADRIVAFGDNANDLPMFAVADECYATANADPEVKAAADGVIGHCDADGVAAFLKRRFSGLF